VTLAGLAVPFLIGTPAARGATAAQVIDMFGRTVNDYGVKLVDWEGYIANPYVELTVKAPQGVPYPVTISLKAEGTSRLMMDLPSRLTATGATKTLTFASASDQKVFRLAIHSKRAPGTDEQYVLRLTSKDASNTTYQQTMPIRVQQDQKTAIEPGIPLHFDYRYDTITGYFTAPAFRTAAEEAVKDWYRFFDVQPFDTVAAGAGNNHLPGNDWANTITITVTNDQAYNGMWVFFRGIQSLYSTRYPAANGKYSTLRQGRRAVLRLAGHRRHAARRAQPGPLHRRDQRPGHRAGRVRPFGSRS
jgi:hypothetical protein